MKQLLLLITLLAGIAQADYYSATYYGAEHKFGSLGQGCAFHDNNALTLWYAAEDPVSWVYSYDKSVNSSGTDRWSCVSTQTYVPADTSIAQTEYHASSAGLVILVREACATDGVNYLGEDGEGNSICTDENECTASSTPDVFSSIGTPEGTSCELGCTTAVTHGECTSQTIDQFGNLVLNCPNGTTEVTGASCSAGTDTTTGLPTVTTEGPTTTTTTTTIINNTGGNTTTNSTTNGGFSVTHENGTSSTTTSETTVVETSEPKTAGGGASCDVAPTCEGDAIACATLYQQWETRCAVEGLDGGSDQGLFTAPTLADTGFYIPTDDTFASVSEGFRDRVMATQFGRVGEIFEVTATGSCPVWTTSVPGLGPITIDQFCSSVATDALGIARAVLILVSSIMAVRIALS